MLMGTDLLLLRICFILKRMHEALQWTLVLVLIDLALGRMELVLERMGLAMEKMDLVLVRIGLVPGTMGVCVGLDELVAGEIGPGAERMYQVL